jgi:hypothetical protein
MQCHLIRRLTRARVAAVAVALGVLAVAVPALGAGPAAADGAGAAFTATRCLSGDGWGATLSISAIHPERNPIAHISTAAGPYAVAVPPAGYATLITGVGEQIIVEVSLTWSDATSQELGVVTADRPGNCVEASAVATTPPPTTCAEAIPPRGDCGQVAATVPPTTAPIGAGARLDIEATLLALPKAPAPQQRLAVATPAASLPATGSFPAALVGAGAAALLAGLALVTAGRATRRAR